MALKDFTLEGGIDLGTLDIAGCPLVASETKGVYTFTGNKLFPQLNVMPNVPMDCDVTITEASVDGNELKMSLTVVAGGIINVTVECTGTKQ